MTDFVNEDYCVVSDDLIFPNVQSCTALIVRGTTGTLGGYHFTVGTHTQQFDAAGRFIVAQLPGQAVDAVYLVGNLSGRTPAVAKDSATAFSAGLKTVLAKALGYANSIFYFDTGPVAGAQGNAVVARRNGGTGALELSLVGQNGWSAAPSVAAPANMFRVVMAKFDDKFPTGAHDKVKVSAASGTIAACTINVPGQPIPLHLMPSI